MIEKDNNELSSLQEMTIGQAILLLIEFSLIYGIGEFPSLILHYYTKCDFNITYALEYLSLVLRIIFYIVFLRVNKKKYNINFKIKKKIKIKYYIFVFLIYLSFTLIYENTLGIAVEFIFGDSITQLFIDKFNKNIISTTILIGIVAPICEEILFRGIILEMLLKKYSTLKSILISALMFALIHGNFMQGVETFFIAIILGYIYYRTDSLLPCIFLHFANNFICVLSLYGYELKIESSNFSLVELIMGVVILISSYFIYRKFIKKENNEKNNVTI